MNASHETGEPTNLPVDRAKASIARVYDAFLGGKDNYEIDRKVRDKILAAAPEMNKLGMDNRKFLSRITRFLAGRAGIDQFIDCGSGLPTAENTHQVAQRENPNATVVYVDNDPTVSAHGRALLVRNEHTHFAVVDFTDPEAVFAHEKVQEFIDFTRPIGFYHVGTLHHLDDDDHPEELMRRNIDALPSGSYVAISHFFNPDGDDPELAELAFRVEDRFIHSPMGSGRFRTREEIMRYLPGLELVEPGLVACPDWWPDGPEVETRSPERNLIVGAVGRKP